MDRYWYATCDHQLDDHTMLRVVGEYEVGSDTCTWTLTPTRQETADPGELVLEFRVTCPPDAPANPTMLQVEYVELDPVEYERISIRGDHQEGLVIDHLGTLSDPSDYT